MLTRYHSHRRRRRRRDQHNAYRLSYSAGIRRSLIDIFGRVELRVDGPAVELVLMEESWGWRDGGIYLAFELDLFFVIIRGVPFC